MFHFQVISDKQLVKKLQKEVARLEALQTPDASEKDLKIQQVNFISASIESPDINLR